MRTWSGVMTTGCPVLSVVRACCARCSPTTSYAASVDSMSSALSSCSKVSCLLSSRVIAVRSHSSAASFRTRDCSSLVLRVAFALLCSDSVFTFQCGLFVVCEFAVMGCEFTVIGCAFTVVGCTHSLRFYQMNSLLWLYSHSLRVWHAHPLRLSHTHFHGDGYSSRSG